MRFFFSIYDVAPAGIILPILFFVLLPAAAIVCVVIALVIIKNRKKNANPSKPKQAKIELVETTPSEKPAANQPTEEDNKNV